MLKTLQRSVFGVAGNLYINFGPEFKVIIEGEKRDLEDIITEVSGNRLVIKKDNWKFNFNERVTVYITMPELKGLGVSGSGKAEIRDAIKAEDLDLSVSGSGKNFYRRCCCFKAWLQHFRFRGYRSWRKW